MSLKQTIYNALFKCATPESGIVPASFESAEAARDHFISMVMAELFPEDLRIAIPAAEPSPKAKKEAKAKAPKKTAAEKAAEKAAAKEAEKAAKVAAKEAEKAAAKAAKEAEKEAAKAAKEAEKAAAKEAAKAAKAAEKASKKSPKTTPKTTPKAEKKSPKETPKAPKKAKKAAKEADKEPNLAKIDPTWRKHLKAAAKTSYTKDMESELLTYLNGLEKTAFDAVGAEKHVEAFLAPTEVWTAADDAALELEAMDALEVEFKGKTYYVDPESKRVYEQDGEVHRAVGYVGMADFADLEIPEDE